MPDELIFPAKCPACGRDTFDDGHYKLGRKVLVCGGCGAEIPPLPPVREVSREQARAEILSVYHLVKNGTTIRYADLARELKLDSKLVQSVCEELIKEGRLERV